MKIHDQHTFNKAVSRALRNLYLLTLPNASDYAGHKHGSSFKREDEMVREDMALIDAHAFRDEYAAMTNSPSPEAQPAVTGD